MGTAGSPKLTLLTLRAQATYHPDRRSHLSGLIELLDLIGLEGSMQLGEAVEYGNPDPAVTP